VSLKERVSRRIAEPVVLRFFQWRGDPLARLMRAEAKADPYPLYSDLRRRGLVRSPLGAWVTSSHSTAANVLRDRRFSRSPLHQQGYQAPTYPPGDPRADLPSADLLTLDPPDHTRLRRLVSGAFSPKAITDLEPWIREVADRLLKPVDGAAGFDLIDTLALPLPIAVICHLLGVPAEDQASFRTWGHDLVGTLDPQAGQGTAESQTRSSELALTAYLRKLVGRRRADPDGSILSALVAAEEEGDRLSSDELVGMAVLLLVAGFETTVNLIGNGVVALLGEQASWERLRAEPELVPMAIEEVLRYDSPVQITSRIATEDVEVDDAVIAKGELIIVAIAGANRDPDVFDRPDRLRIDRQNATQHLSFSLGIHHCLGAALARLEGRVAFEELTRRYPSLEMAGTPSRRPLLVLRGFESIPVRASG
jgi:cytochrome P450